MDNQSEQLIAELLDVAKNGGTSEEVRGALTTILGGTAVDEYLRQELKKISKDGGYLNDGWGVNEMILGEDGHARLSLNVIGPSRKNAYTIKGPTWVGATVSNRGNRVDVDEFHIEHNGSARNSESRVSSHVSYKLSLGEAIELKPDIAYRFIATVPMAIVSLYLGDQTDVMMSVDCQKGELVKTEHIALEATALRTASEILGTFGSDRSFDVLKGLLAHESHHVRWAAASAMVQISPRKALPRVQDLESDAHPSIRMAAKKTSERILKQLNTE